jgi:hypothetical protein
MLMFEFPEKDTLSKSQFFSIDDFDFDLLTFAEYSILIADSLKIDELMLKRAEELGFNLALLTEEQKSAALLCTTSKEIEVAKRLLEILLKIQRLNKRLSKDDRTIVEAHVKNTWFFGNLNSKNERAKKEYLKIATDDFIGAAALLYSEIMKKYGEKMFEGIFDFLPKKRRNPVVDAAFSLLFKHGVVKLEWKWGGEDA